VAAKRCPEPIGGALDAPLEQAARALEHAPHVGSTDVHPSSLRDTERTQHARAWRSSSVDSPKRLA
jgi:hypothetical protein